MAKKKNKRKLRLRLFKRQKNREDYLKLSEAEAAAGEIPGRADTPEEEFLSPKEREKKKKRKEGRRRRLILLAVFVVALIFMEHSTNQGNANMAVSMDAAKRPEISFACVGYNVNSLYGYVREMDITTMRDTIIPVSNQLLNMRVTDYDNEVTGIDYALYTMDGETELLSDYIDAPSSEVQLDLGADTEDGSLLSEERNLVIVLTLSDGTAYHYYSRVVDAEGKNAELCLDYINSFHDYILEKAEGVGVGKALESSEEGDNDQFQHITIHNEFNAVTFGDLEPEVIGTEHWEIKEINSVYTSATLSYQIRGLGEDGEVDTYNVTEFYKVRYKSSEKKMALLDYDRTMEEVFDPTGEVLDENGILLGIVPTDVEYMQNTDGDNVSFVQAGELWNYDKESGEFTLVFSFTDPENTDSRNLVPQHEIQILNMDDDGDTTFAVIGYMNRGIHEGEVGASICYFNQDTNSMEEVAFIACDESYEIAKGELGELVYYDDVDDKLYLISEGTLYQIGVKRGSKKELTTGLDERVYVVSDDNSMIAYQDEKNERKITEYNFAEGEGQTIKCESGATLVPLGFIYDDLVYGIARDEDAGETTAGTKISPMYKLEIVSPAGETLMDYEKAGVYVTSTTFDTNMLTLSRVVKSGSKYESTGEDYISNNEEIAEDNINKKMYYTDQKGNQVRLTFTDGIQKLSAQYMQPTLRMSTDVMTFEFDMTPNADEYYVYGHGTLQGLYDTAAEGIAAADEVSGVVLSPKLAYVWEKSNRDLTYTMEDDQTLVSLRKALNDGMSPIEAAEEVSKTNALDLTGCKCKDLLYVVNRGYPVIAMLTEKQAVILVGYGETYVTYINVSTGERENVSFSNMDKMTTATQNTYIGCLAQ